ncbi:PQQ-like beta-propeller repeat protein [Nocardioides sp. InS609-2]|uniref:PQQ-like beta-propeller repeat protein n=1 Tax=Nocardioides sp. InS609-2 TaxID=2760705 RepID=UPI0020BFF6B5|nr:PQQ-like beta-propeller repeat protein [Nocardioides sp. InS609-2]
MTERLSQLIHDEARGLDIPAPSTDAILTRGRRTRRRQQALTGAAALAVVAVVAGGAVFAGSIGDDTARDIAPADTVDTGPSFAVGNTVYLDGGKVQATIADKAVKSLYYTSAGTLVRHGENDFSDRGGPQRFSLVTPNGDVLPVSVVTEETVPGVDPDQPYLAYAVITDGRVEVVVHDITTDTEVARVPVTDDFEGGWNAPPVAIEGDLVYVGTDTAPTVVNWRTGEESSTDRVDGPLVQVSGGRSVVQRADDHLTVLDVATGEMLDLIELPPSEYGTVLLSPDGRYAMVGDQVADPGGESADTTVRTIGSGDEVVLDGPSYDWGWTADGDLFRITGKGLQTCAADSGICDTTPLPDGLSAEAAEVKLGGQLYES